MPLTECKIDNRFCFQNVHRWIPGGKGSSISNSSSLGGAVQQRQLNTRRRAVMGPVPRDVRAGVLEMVVGKGRVVHSSSSMLLDDGHHESTVC